MKKIPKSGVIESIIYWWVVSTYPSEKYESVGIMTFPTEWKNEFHVPNHQPDYEHPLMKSFHIPYPHLLLHSYNMLKQMAALVPRFERHIVS